MSRQDFAASLSGIPSPYEDPARFVQTQIDLARVPAVARRALATAGRPAASLQSLLSNSDVTAGANSDLLTFSVVHGDPSVAEQLATAYAREFTAYRRQLDTVAVRRARKQVEERIEQFGGLPERESALYESYAGLVDRREQLRTLEALQTSNASVVREAGPARQIQPRPVRNGVLGLGLGLLLGIGLAFLWHSLDTRVRSAEEIGEQLGLPLLARLSPPSRRLRRDDRLVMLAEPTSANAEEFRLFRTNLDFVKLEHRAQVILVTSAHQGERKSTSVANLAVTLARSGQRVVLVDLDLRRPYLDRFFDLPREPGLTDVALGRLPLDEAIRPVTINGAVHGGDGNGTGPSVAGLLDVLPTGALPPDPGEFTSTRALDNIFAELRSRANIVLVDAPPLLHIGDAVALSTHVDGMLLVTRLSEVNRATLRELRRVLGAAPAAALGYVVTGVSQRKEYGGPYYESALLPGPVLTGSWVGAPGSPGGA